MPALAFAEPEHPFGPEHRVGQLVVEEVLEAAQIKRRIYRQGYGAETLQLRRMGVVIVMGVIVSLVVMLVVGTVRRVMGVVRSVVVGFMGKMSRKAMK